MDKLSLPLKTTDDRQRAAYAVMRAPCDAGLMVEIKPESRSTLQNSRMWAMLQDIASQVVLSSEMKYVNIKNCPEGRKLSKWEWKCVYTAALWRLEVVPGLEGGFVVLGQETSRMSMKQMNDLMMLMEADGYEKQVIFKTPDEYEEWKNI